MPTKRNEISETEKDEKITLRLFNGTTPELQKLAKKSKRELPDYIRRVLKMVAEKGMTI